MGPRNSPRLRPVKTETAQRVHFTSYVRHVAEPWRNYTAFLAVRHASRPSGRGFMAPRRTSQEVFNREGGSCLAGSGQACLVGCNKEKSSAAGPPQQALR